MRRAALAVVACVVCLRGQGFVAPGRAVLRSFTCPTQHVHAAEPCLHRGYAELRQLSQQPCSQSARRHTRSLQMANQGHPQQPLQAAKRAAAAVQRLVVQTVQRLQSLTQSKGSTAYRTVRKLVLTLVAVLAIKTCFAPQIAHAAFGIGKRSDATAITMDIDVSHVMLL